MRQFDSFSSAIRAGIEMRPNQCFYKFYDNELNANCGIGAGVEGILGRPLTAEDLQVWRQHPTLKTEIEGRYSYMQKPIDAMPCGCVELTDGPKDFKESDGFRIDCVCVHLNNLHQWTREQIADWLQGVEDELFGYETIVDVPREDGNTMSIITNPETNQQVNEDEFAWSRLSAVYLEGNDQIRVQLYFHPVHKPLKFYLNGEEAVLMPIAKIGGD